MTKEPGAARRPFRLEEATIDELHAAIKAGESYTIPPGHDAWVEGTDPFVGIEVMSAEQYAKPTA